MRVLLMAMLASCASAQLKFDIHPVTGRASDRLVETQRRVRVAQQLIWREPKADEERAVLEAVVRVCGWHFQHPINTKTRIATITEKGQDILIARWPGAEGAYSELIVWDTPKNTSFIFKLPAHSWSSNAAIQSSFEKLLLPPVDSKTPPANSVTLSVARDPLTHQWIGAGGLPVDYGLRQFDLGPYNWLDLWETPTASYLSASFSMYATAFPPNMREIAERFPPLESRVERWSKMRLIDELGPAGVAVGGPARRDHVLALELVKRDLTDDELLVLLLRRLAAENGAVMDAIVESGQVARFSIAIRRYLSLDAPGSPKLAARPFDTLNRAKDVNFTDVAIECLRQDLKIGGAFRYAIAHGSIADYRVLSELPISNDFGLREMRKRLGIDEDGNPIPKK